MDVRFYFIIYRTVPLWYQLYVHFIIPRAFVFIIEKLGYIAQGCKVGVIKTFFKNVYWFYRNLDWTFHMLLWRFYVLTCDWRNFVEKNYHMKSISGPVLNILIYKKFRTWLFTSLTNRYGNPEPLWQLIQFFIITLIFLIFDIEIILIVPSIPLLKYNLITSTKSTFLTLLIILIIRL